MKNLRLAAWIYANDSEYVTTATEQVLEYFRAFLVGRIGWSAPLARALVGARIGDERVILGSPVAGKQVTVRLDPSRPWWAVARVQISAELRTRLRSVRDYVRRLLQPETLETFVDLDPMTAMPASTPAGASVR